MINAKKAALNLIRSSKEMLKPVVGIFTINFVFILAQLIYLNLRFNFLKSEIPLWYTMPWGELQLGQKGQIFTIPAIETIITCLGILFIVFTKKKYLRFGETVISLVVTFTNIMLAYSLFRITRISLLATQPLINPHYLDLIQPFMFALVVSYFVAPRFIDFAKEKGIITDPSTHKHPAMILQKPSTRGGGIVFVISLLVTSLFFVNLSKEVLGTVLSSILLAALGLADDYQNTHPNSKIKFLEKPCIRLGIMFLLVAVIVPFGIKIDFVSNPFNGVYQIPSIIAALLTIIWVVWTLNLLSWSNGVDGQYSGIIGIAGIVVAVLALRFKQITPFHENYARLAVIAAGASIGLLPFSWHPSKIMWGFGAVSARVILSSISILINAKITTSILILLIPFIDAFVTVGRRIIQKKNPLKGDKGHLHHLLLDRGWKPQKVALFYWSVTALCGIVSVLSAEKMTAQTTLTFMGLGAFFIILLNLKSLGKKPQSPKAV